MRGKLDPGHKGYFMFRVYRMFNIAQLAGGILQLSFLGGAGHLSVLILNTFLELHYSLCG